MRAKPSGVVIAAVVAGLLVYALAGYFLLISPQKGKAADFKRQAETSQLQIDQYRAAAAKAQATPPIRVAELFRLTKAMPDSLDMSGVILELSRVARESGIGFDSITPQGAAPIAGYSSVPLSVNSGELLRALGLPVPAPQPRACGRGTPGCQGAALRRRLDELRREHALVSRDQGKPDGARLRLRRCDARGPAGRDCARHDGHDVDDHAAHHDHAHA